MAALRVFNHWLLKGVELLLVLLILAMVAMGFGQVVLRKLFDTGYPAVSTILQYSVLWVTFLGATLATHRQKHIQIDILAQILPTRFRRWLVLLVSLAGVGLCIVLFRGGIGFFREFPGTQWTASNNPFWNISLAVGFGLILLEFGICALNAVWPEKPVLKAAWSRNQSGKGGVPPPDGSETLPLPGKITAPRGDATGKDSKDDFDTPQSPPSEESKP